MSPLSSTLTLPLLLGVLLAVWQRKRYLGRIALAGCWPIWLGVVQRDRAAAAYAEHIDQRGHFASGPRSIALATFSFGLLLLRALSMRTRKVPGGGRARFTRAAASLH